MILVVGDIMLDEYIVGSASRLSPEAPVPVVTVKNHFYTLGGAGNVANNLAQLNEEVTLMGVVGNDSNANTILELLEKNKIKNEIIQDKTIPTTTKTRVISGTQQIVRYDREVIKQQEELNALFQNFVQQNSVSYIIISDYDKGVCSAELMKTIGSSKNCKVCIDPKGTNWDKYKNAYLVKPNLKELSEVFGKNIENTEEAIIKAATSIKEKYNIENILVTRSEKGMTFISHNETFTVKSKPLNVYDVSGAGDTVMATLIYALQRNYSFPSAVELANKAGEIVVQEQYVQTINKEKLQIK